MSKDVIDIYTTTSFTEIIDSLLAGNKVRRQEWGNDGTYLVIENEKLMIFKPEDKQLHPLIISTGDLLGEDWIIVGDRIQSN